MWGGIQDFPSNFFCLTVPKIFIGQPFSVSSISGIEKFYASECMSRFPSNIFCLTVPKQFVGELFCAAFQKISGSKKVYGQEERGSIKISFENYLSHSAEKGRRGPLQSFIDFGYRKSFDERVGGIQKFSVEHFLSRSAEKIRRATH